MGTVSRFEDLRAWQQARSLVDSVYRLTIDTEIRRDFVLRDQLCRAAVSCMTNIAEGFGRHGNREFARFLDIAIGSAREVQSLLYIALDLRYIGRDQFESLYGNCQQTLSKMIPLAIYLRKRT